MRKGHGPHVNQLMAVLLPAPALTLLVPAALPNGKQVHVQQHHLQLVTSAFPVVSPSIPTLIRLMATLQPSTSRAVTLHSPAALIAPIKCWTPAATQLQTTSALHSIPDLED